MFRRIDVLVEHFRALDSEGLGPGFDKTLIIAFMEKQSSAAQSWKPYSSANKDLSLHFLSPSCPLYFPPISNLSLSIYNALLPDSHSAEGPHTDMCPRWSSGRRSQDGLGWTKDGYAVSLPATDIPDKQKLLYGSVADVAVACDGVFYTALVSLLYK
ncbi:hypothetical protein LA080_003997 [Diaporthe eres]|nr:hypothetical protein LA080_003997 [Diaporthe eres]